MSLSPDQVAERLSGVTATDAGCIVGANPYRTPIAVYLEKTGAAPPFVGNVRSRWGELLEPLIREDYEERHDVRVEVPGTLADRRRAWAKATPDGIVYPRGASTPERGLEIKVHGRDAVVFGKLSYGAPGTDDVPEHELIQCAWNMFVADLPRWDLVAFLDGAPVEYVIERDDELIELLVERCERFLVDHVQARQPPDPDGSAAWDDFLKARWKGADNGAVIAIDGNAELLAIVERLRVARAGVAEIEGVRDALEQQLKAVIGENSGLSWRMPGQKKPAKITWKRNRSGVVTDWQAAVADMRAAAALVVSAKVDAFDRAIAALDPASELAEILSLALATLRELAEGKAVVARTSVVGGARPFLCPRTWKGTAA